MDDLHISKHAKTRMAQRGFRQGDINLILELGTEVEGGLVVREQDFRRFEKKLRDQLKHANRLIGKRLVLADGMIVTAYHASRSDTKRLLRN